MSVFHRAESELTGVERLSHHQGGHSWKKRVHTWLGMSSTWHRITKLLRSYSPATVPAKKSSLGSKAAVDGSEGQCTRQHSYKYTLNRMLTVRIVVTIIQRHQCSFQASTIKEEVQGDEWYSERPRVMRDRALGLALVVDNSRERFRQDPACIVLHP